MLQNIGIIFLCLTVIFLLYKSESLDRKFDDIKGRFELILRRFKNLDDKHNK